MVTTLSQYETIWELSRDPQIPGLSLPLALFGWGLCILLIGAALFYGRGFLRAKSNQRITRSVAGALPAILAMAAFFGYTGYQASDDYVYYHRVLDYINRGGCRTVTGPVSHIMRFEEVRRGPSIYFRIGFVAFRIYEWSNDPGYHNTTRSTLIAQGQTLRVTYCTSNRHIVKIERPNP